MNPAYEPIMARVKILTEAWAYSLDLPGVTLRHRWNECYHDDDPSTCADTAAEWQYRNATIMWYLPALIRLEPHELENVVVHELTHVLLGPINDRLKAGSDDLLEMVTENVARALLHTKEVAVA